MKQKPVIRLLSTQDTKEGRLQQCGVSSFQANNKTTKGFRPTSLNFLTAKDESTCLLHIV